MTHWRGQNMSGRITAGGDRHPSASRSRGVGDSSDYELSAGMLWALVVFGPAIVVLGTAFGYMALAPLFGLPPVPAF